MGVENSFHFDKASGRWLERGKDPLPEEGPPPPPPILPPPLATSSAPLPAPDLSELCISIDRRGLQLEHAELLNAFYSTTCRQKW